MLLEIIAPNGSCGFVDNKGQVNGQVVITGDKDMVRVLDFLLNKDLEVPPIMVAAAKQKYPEDLLIRNDRNVLEVWKASDKYLTEYFLTLIEEAFRWMGVSKFK